MNCNKLTSSKWTARLGHSWKSSESACPYLVQGTHSFKGNGKGWGLLKCQSTDTDFLLHNLCLYWDAILILFFRSSSDCKSLIVNGKFASPAPGWKCSWHDGIHVWMQHQIVSLSGFSAWTNVIPSHRYFICISASVQYELMISIKDICVYVCCF